MNGRPHHLKFWHINYINTMKGLEMAEINISNVVVSIAGIDIDVAGTYDVEKEAALQFEAQAIAIKLLAQENVKLREEVDDLNRENENLWHAQREGR